jgi:uncharacterized membrane protein YfcA
VLTWVSVTVALLAASFVKGTTGMGFPLIATPMVAMLVDLKTTYALLILPNIVMDIFQVIRGGSAGAVWRRMGPLIAASVVGVFLGTQIFLAISARAVYGCLAVMIGLFLATAWLRIEVRVRPSQERWLGSVAGLVGGLLNGIANVSGPPTAIYLMSLGLDKREFVKAMASIFLMMKVSQMAAITQGGILSGSVLLASAGLTLLSLVGFWGGLKLQDRIPQRGFNRFVQLLLSCMACYFAYRAIA